MKKMTVALLCAVMTFSLFATEPETGKAEKEKQISELQAERKRVQLKLIKVRNAAILTDKRAAKLAKEILVLNRQLSDYLDTKDEVKELNRELGRIDRQIRTMKLKKIGKSEKKDSK